MTRKPTTAAAQPPTRRKGATTSLAKNPAPPPADRDAIVLAAAIGAHGIDGEVRLKVFADDLTVPRVFNDGALTLVALRANGIGRFAEIGDRTAAEALRGTLLTVPRASLPPLAEGEYYHADLIGLAVVATDGMSVGRVAGIENFGAGDIVEVERPDGRRFMVPIHAVPGWDATTLTIDAAFVE